MRTDGHVCMHAQDALRLDCQVLVHPGDHEGHLRGHGQSSFGGLEHKPWPLRLFRERTADMAKAMASDHGRALATANATAMAARHRTHPRRRHRRRHACMPQVCLWRHRTCPCVHAPTLTRVT